MSRLIADGGGVEEGNGQGNVFTGVCLFMGEVWRKGVSVLVGGGLCPGGGIGPGGLCPGGEVCVWGGWGLCPWGRGSGGFCDREPLRISMTAAGAHPTGMHSCFFFFPSLMWNIDIFKQIDRAIPFVNPVIVV